MRTTLLILLGMLAVYTLPAQTLERQVLASAGETFTGSNATVEMTTGELAIATFSSSASILTQGFQQTRLTVTAVDDQVIPDLHASYEIKVYPNPVQDQLFFEITGDLLPVRTILSDMRGKFVAEQPEIQMGQRHSFPMQQLADGMYFLRVFDATGKPLKTFKVTKTN